MLPRPPGSTLFPYTTLFRSLTLRGTPVLYYGDEIGLPDTPLRESDRSEEHTSELQSRFELVCRLLLEKKKATLAAAHWISQRVLQAGTLLVLSAPHTSFRSP